MIDYEEAARVIEDVGELGLGGRWARHGNPRCGYEVLRHHFGDGVFANLRYFATVRANDDYKGTRKGRARHVAAWLRGLAARDE